MTATSELEGVILGERYRMVQPLGVGGFGEVWAAEHVMRPERVAIKILHANVVHDPASVQRFFREARAVETIDHPSVIHVFDTGVHQGRPYLVMELLLGRTLRACFDDPGMPAEQKIMLLEQAIEGLRAAHAKGFVHRDLKPSNIYVTSNGVKLLDFGLVRHADESGLTKTGMTLGTPHYTSPEQAHSARSARAPTDVWAFGCMIYEAFVGERPFAGESAADVLVNVCTKPPPSMPASVPEPWAALVSWCLQKSPQDRPKDGAALSLAFEAARKGLMLESKNIDPHGPTMLPAEESEPQVAGSVSGTEPTVASQQVVSPAPTGAMTRGKKKIWPVVLVLAAAAIGSAMLVVFLLDGLNQQPEQAPVASNVPPEVLGAALPVMGQVWIVAPDIQGAQLFVDAQDRGALEGEMVFELAPGTHRVEARRGDRIVAATAVELEAGEVAEVTLGESAPVQIRHRTVSTMTTMTTMTTPPTTMAPVAIAPVAMAPTIPITMAAPVIVTMTTPGFQPAPVAPVVTPIAPMVAAPIMVAVRPPATPMSRPPTDREMERTLRALRPRVLACVGSWRGELPASVTFSSDGEVRSRIGRGPTGSQRRCVQSVINEHAGSQFTGRRSRIRFNYRL